MKRLIALPLLLFACAAAAAPPEAAPGNEAEQAGESARIAADHATQAADEAARAGTEAALASAESAREAADAQKLAELQKRMNDLAQRMAELSGKIGDQAGASALRYLSDSKRGMLGVVLDGDADGLRVSGVTPGGPAERAGVRDGDVITAIDGSPVRDGGDVRLADRLVAGKPVRLSVSRDGRTLQMRVIPQRFQAADWQALARTAQTAAQRSLEKFNSPEFRKQMDLRVELATKQAEKARAEIAAHWRDNFEVDGRWFAPWWGLNLASMNPELGGYFGTARGALVLSSDAKRFPGLQAGDVITEVDGSAISKPEDAMRALQAVPNDKPVRLSVLPHGKRLAVERKAPPRWDLVPPAPPAAPLAPAAPAAVAEPAAVAAPGAPAAPPAPEPPARHGK